MSNTNNYLDTFFTPSTQGTQPVALLDVPSYSELPQNLVLGNITYSGTLTADRTIVYPPPADGTNATSYVRTIFNGTNHSLLLNVQGGGGLVTIASGKTAWVIFEVAGPRRLTADV